MKLLMDSSEEERELVLFLVVDCFGVFLPEEEGEEEAEEEGGEEERSRVWMWLKRRSWMARWCFCVDDGCGSGSEWSIERERGLQRLVMLKLFTGIYNYY